MKSKNKKIISQNIIKNPLKEYYPICVLILLFLGLAIYYQTFGFGFVFDDNVFIVKNLCIRNYSDMHYMWLVYPKTRLIGFYSFALNYSINQLNPLGYHVFNFLVHLLATGLVWALSRVLFQITNWFASDNQLREGCAFFIALLFLVHPGQTQAVTYIAQRFESIAAVFYFGTILFYLYGRISFNKTHKIFYFAVAGLLALLGILTKETAATIPAMVLAIEFILFNKGSLNLKKLQSWKLYVLVVILGIIFVFLFMKIVRTDFNIYFNFNQPSDSHDGDMITGGKYVLTQMRVFLTFLRILIFPVNQNLDYDYPLSTGLLGPPLTLVGLCMIAFIAFLVFRLRQQLSLISFGLAWVLITFSINTAPRVNIIFEHKLYLISFGFFLAAVCALATIIKDRKFLFGLLAILIAVLSIVSYKRNQVWKDDLTIWSDAVSKSPHKARPFYNLGVSYGDQDKSTQALLAYNKAIQFKPKYAEAYNNRGLIYDNLNKHALAISDFNKAIGINPGYAEAYNNRGLSFYRQGKFNQAISNYNKAVALNSRYAVAYNNIGVVECKMKELNQAVSNFSKAIEIDPSYADAYKNREIVYTQQSNFIQLITDSSKAIAVNPNDVGAYKDRGNAYDKLGNNDQAISDYSKAIEINPNDAESYKNLGTSYDKQGDFTQALSNYNKAIALNPKYVDAFYNRGLVYAKQGNMVLAIFDFNKAIMLEPMKAEAYHNRGSAYFVKGEYIQAITDYNKAIEIDPKYAEAYRNRAITYFRLKEYGHAWADEHKAEELGAATNPVFIKELRQATGHD